MLVGVMFTVTVTVLGALTQPAADVPLTVYSVVTLGDTEIVAVVADAVGVVQV